MYLPRPSSKYHGCYPKYFEKHLPRLLNTDKYLHAFCGSAQTGFRIDLKFETKPDVVCDVHYLPFRDEVFGGVVADPPYNAKFAKILYDVEDVHYYKYMKEFIRVTKKGGRIGILHNFVMGRVKGTKYYKVVAILVRIWQFTKIFTIFEKPITLEQFTNKAMSKHEV